VPDIDARPYVETAKRIVRENIEALRTAAITPDEISQRVEKEIELRRQTEFPEMPEDVGARFMSTIREFLIPVARDAAGYYATGMKTTRGINRWCEGGA
jgi:hypothetical protein